MTFLGHFWCLLIENIYSSWKILTQNCKCNSFTIDKKVQWPHVARGFYVGHVWYSLSKYCNISCKSCLNDKARFYFIKFIIKGFNLSTKNCGSTVWRYLNNYNNNNSNIKRNDADDFSCGNNFSRNLIFVATKTITSLLVTTCRFPVWV